jgi:hypothetical protein
MSTIYRLHFANNEVLSLQLVKDYADGTYRFFDLVENYIGRQHFRRKKEALYWLGQHCVKYDVIQQL